MNVNTLYTFNIQGDRKEKFIEAGRKGRNIGCTNIQSYTLLSFQDTQPQNKITSFLRAPLQLFQSHYLGMRLRMQYFQERITLKYNPKTLLRLLYSVYY